MCLRGMDKENFNFYSMGVSGKLPALAVVPPGKEPPLPTELEVGWTPQPVSTVWKEISLFPLPGIERRFLGRPVCSAVTYYSKYAVSVRILCKCAVF
jgi:hypothetical protein